MGCCQSKSKAKDISNGVDETAHSDTHRPALVRYDDPPSGTDENARTPTKHIVPPEDQDNSIPLDSLPALSVPGVDEARDGEDGYAKKPEEAAIQVSMSANNAENSADNGDDEVQLRRKVPVDVDSDVRIQNDLTKDKKTNEPINRTTITLSPQDKSTNDLVRPVVDAPQEPISTKNDSQSDEDDKEASLGTPVDLEDVSLGQGVTEIEMTGGQTIDLEEEDQTRDSNHGPVSETPLLTTVSTGVSHISSSSGPDSSEGDDGKNSTEKGTSGRESPDFQESATNFHTPDSPNIRYQNRESTENKLPDELPKPAPPKSRKKDLIKPNQFVVVDKIVDQAPNDGFQSVPKLGQYLSGKVKLSDVKGIGEGIDGDMKNLPPPIPTKRKKKDIIPDLSVFKHVDENARNTPESVRTSVPKLAEHLCRVAKTDLEKVRAFYYWICNNIRYLYDKDNPIPDKLKFDAATTLRQGQGSFVSVFVALCQEVNIPALTILGCSKGLRHQPDRHFHVAERNHCWNAVYIDDEWRFIECTWGSGYMDMDGKFQQQFDNYWFLTDPEVFVYDHFPTHPIWQLLEEPIDIDEFNNKPSMTEKSREVGFQLLSHREPIVYFKDEVTIKFSTEVIPLSNMTADLRTQSGKEVNSHRCIQRLDANTFEVRVVPPAEGEYCLLIYGKSKDYLHAKFRKLMEYTLRCDEVYSNPVSFPSHLKAWGPEPNYAKYGFADDIQSMSVFTSDEREIIITLNQTINTAISAELKTVEDDETVLKDLVMLTAEDDLKKDIHIRFPHEGYFKLEVYAEGESGKYEYAAGFLIHCQCSIKEKPDIFPKYNVETVCKHQCSIVEPLKRELPANTTMMFRMKSVGLKRAMLGIPMDKDYDSKLKMVGEFTKGTDLIFEGSFKTPKKGERLLISGSAAPPNVFWTRAYEFVTV